MEEKKRILVVDDDDDLLKMVVSEFLEVHGFFVNLASRAQEGLDLIKSKDFNVDLLITDIEMKPNTGDEVEDGIELTKKTKEFFPKLPVIILSGGFYMPDAKKLIDQANSAGANYLLAKPVDPEQLLQVVHDALN